MRVAVRDGEPFERALKRFARRVQESGVLKEAKERRHYEKPSVKKKRKALAAARRARKAARAHS